MMARLESPDCIHAGVFNLSTIHDDILLPFMAFIFLKYAYVEEEMSRNMIRNHTSIGKKLLD